MRPLLLQCCPPLPGQLASKSTGKAETEYPLCQGPQNLHSLQQHNKKSFFSQNHGITYKCSKKVNRDQESKVVVGHAILSSTVQLNCTTQASSHCSFHVQKRFSFVRNIGSNLAHSTSACQGRYLTGTEALVLSYPRLSNKCLDIQSHAFEITMHFSAECTGALWRKPARELSTFRVHAQNGNPGKSWWKRFLLDPIDSKDFPIPVPDTEDEAEGDRDDSGQNSRDFGKGNSGEDWCKDDIDRMLADDASFAAWQQRNKARNELRESQKLGRDPGNVDWDWEDWLDDSWGDYNSYFGGKDRGWYSSQSDWEKGGLPRSPPKMPERGMSRTMKELLFRIFENEEEVKEDLAFEEKVFRFTSQTTVKFVAVLVFVPWLVAYISHDFVIVPFLNRYVETVPLAAELLDLRESQKLNMVETLKLERQRVRFEAALGKAPPLSDEELLEHIREEALELRDELRLENRKAFGNIWSDILAGLTVFLLLVFNPEKVAIMRLTGNRLFTNISDTGKAFIIILLSDIFLGYHSESGWETVVEMFLEHYGFQVEQASIYIFVAIVPVAIDACFKLWVFRFLTMLSPSATATFREMKRH